MFISIYSTGDIYVSNQAQHDPKVHSNATGTLVTCVRVNSDAGIQKVCTLTGSGNSSASALADSAGKGTGASGSRFSQKELT